MRVHFSPIVTVFAALLLVSGTVGCRSNGGPWYNPTTYSFSNPFGKDRQTSPHSSSMAKTKPSLDAHPNISIPHGGYTDSASHAGSPGSSGGTMSSSPPEHLAQYNNPTMQQNSPNPHGSYTVADPSQYSPYTYTESHAGQGSSTSPYPNLANQGQQSPYPYRQESVQQAQNYPAMPYGEQYTQNTQTAYQTTSAYQPQPTNNVPTSPYGSMEQPSPYASPGTIPQSDPYASTQQQTAVSPSGFGQDQFGQNPSASTPYTYPGGGVSVASPYQPYQPPAANGGHSY